MAFGVATVVTKIGKAMLADRQRATPGTYTTSPHWIGMGTGATAAARTAANTDTALSTEVDTRAVGTESTVTITNTGDTYQVAGTQTAGANRSIDEAGTFDALTVGHMAVSATMNVISLTTGDGIAWTFQEQLT